MIDQAETLRNIVKANENNVQIKKISVQSKVITVSSGKGGVGKTNFVANLAVALRRLGKTVAIIDADLGLANVEVLFNVIPQKSLRDVIYNGESIHNILSEGPLGIKFMSGGSGMADIVDISPKEQEKMINAFSYIDSMFDYILIDTGAGISETIINFIKVADETIIVTTPEPTSITDAYALIKVVKEKSENDINIKLVVNRVEDNEEGDMAVNKICRVSEKFLNLKIECIGYARTDENLVKSVKRQMPISIIFPNSDYALDIERIAKNITSTQTINDYVVKPIENNNLFNKLLKVFKK